MAERVVGPTGDEQAEAMDAMLAKVSAELAGPRANAPPGVAAMVLADDRAAANLVEVL